MNAIFVNDLFKLSDVNIIDLRLRYDYNNGHILNAINIPFYELDRNFLHLLNKNEIYYLYCDYGEKSKLLSLKLNSLGYQTFSIIGGYNAYLMYISNIK